MHMQEHKHKHRHRHEHEHKRMRPASAAIHVNSTHKQWLLRRLAALPGSWTPALGLWGLCWGLRLLVRTVGLAGVGHLHQGGSGQYIK